MTEASPFDALEAAGYVEFLSTGDTATGEYQCSDCGYGVAVQRVVPLCPMCGGTAWEQSAWRPFTRRRLQ